MHEGGLFHSIVGLVLLLAGVVWVILIGMVIYNGTKNLIRALNLEVPDIEATLDSFYKRERDERRGYEERVLKYKHPLSIKERLYLWAKSPAVYYYIKQKKDN